MFDGRRYPKSWKEQSLDFRLMFVYHFGMMGMFVAGSKLTVRLELEIAAGLLFVLAMISRRHRKVMRWRWPGVGTRDQLKALAAGIFLLVFLYSATPLFPPSSGQMLPWYLAGSGIGLFNVLTQLKVVEQSEADFLRQCATVDEYGREIEPPPLVPPPPMVEESWKKITRRTFQAVSACVWILFVLFFYSFGTSIKNGAPEPTMSKTEPLQDHGSTVYVTPAEKRRIDALESSAMIGIPVILVGGVLLHFVLGVKLIPNAPTLAEIWKSKKRGMS